MVIQYAVITGGNNHFGSFSNKAASVGFFDSALIDYILGIAMIMFGINFNIY